MRNVIALLGFASGAGLLVLGIQDNNLLWLGAGLAALLIGVRASFRVIVCPACGARAWVSGTKTHCMNCGAQTSASKSG